LLAFILMIGTLVVGWLAWTVVEWRHGRTASYRIRGLRVVRRSDGRPIGWGRSFLRNGVCCTLLFVPTALAYAVCALAFVMGASPPDGLLRRPRHAPWDILTGTEVVRAGSGLRPLRLGRLSDDIAISLN
jgi:hypothetical protein